MRPLTGTPNLEPVRGTTQGGLSFIYFWCCLKARWSSVCSVCFVSSVFVVTARFAAMNPAIKRIKADIRELQTDPSDMYYALPLEVLLAKHPVLCLLGLS